MTGLYAVIGNPIAHSRSPAIHHAFAQQTEQILSYERLLAPLDDFAGTLESFRQQGGYGANVTVPFKEQAWQLAKTRSARAELAGAVNTLAIQPDGSWYGDNTDGAGLVQDIQNAGWELRGRRVLLIGAGGAARGVLQPLLAAEVDCICIANRTVTKAQALLALFPMQPRLQACTLDSLSVPGQRPPFDIIINATSASLSGEVPVIDASCWHETSAVYDMMYGKSTAFLDWAKAQSITHCRDGLGMLVEQAAESFYLWRGVRPETQPVLALLRKEINQS
ncbi:MAG: shikimate dehydrogenase [Moraxellaceae bacterium]|nr:shikimate dehydrogenase [Moraxellaceae bacterium]MDZ4386464.1 shikimate dehydrogenase [Moraxellaceae bacterium]